MPSVVLKIFCGSYGTYARPIKEGPEQIIEPGLELQGI
jgi:hypothetical protein